MFSFSIVSLAMSDKRHSDVKACSKALARAALTRPLLGTRLKAFELPTKTQHSLDLPKVVLATASLTSLPDPWETGQILSSRIGQISEMHDVGFEKIVVKDHMFVTKVRLAIHM